jgi:hypothetical protein
MKVEKTFEDISHNDEKVRGKGITLAQSSFAVDPAPGLTVQEDSSFARMKKSLHPNAP